MKLKFKVNTDLVQGFSLHHSYIVNKKSKSTNLGNYESGIDKFVQDLLVKMKQLITFIIQLEESN